jgi:hypothetical protein
MDGTFRIRMGARERREGGVCVCVDHRFPGNACKAAGSWVDLTQNSAAIRAEKLNLGNRTEKSGKKMRFSISKHSRVLPETTSGFCSRRCVRSRLLHESTHTGI